MQQKSYYNNLEDHFNEAVSLQQNGETEKACKLYTQILDVMPDSPLVNYNMGTALFSIGKYHDAHRCYKKALISAPEEVDLLYNLALCTKRLGLLRETIKYYKKILKLNHEDRESLYNLACCYKDAGMDENAISCYNELLQTQPESEAVLNNLAYLYHKNEKYSDAVKMYVRLLKAHPDHHAAKHMLNSLSGEKCEAVPFQYIKEIFDNYSSRYEKSLVSELEYKVPLNLRRLFDATCSVPKKSMSVLDLGCGTGLGGEAFAELCKTATGVDISSNMIDLASAKEIYSSLHVTEIHEYLEECSNTFSLILATDVLGYIGKLEKIFIKLFRVAEDGAFFCFSVEKGEENGYELRTSGRFAHSFNYIQTLCDQTGWQLEKHEITALRRERDVWIEGMLFIVNKPATREN
ncbi:MAG: tetratricopeptide repeat protein [Desulfopila sp.]|jgi:predicted TPR repeat methyltransferase|nr:tetratricopeptide repeat protein [Desulfopila sp.]